MLSADAEIAFDQILDGLGLYKGANIMLGIDMARIPLPKIPTQLNKACIADREFKWCTFVLSRLQETIGSQGTVIVPTFSYSCGEPGAVFITESTRSEIGPFTEYFRQHAQAVRSLHPIFSLAAIGANAERLMQSESGCAFGPTSPFGNFRLHNVCFVTLGLRFSGAVTYAHHLEQGFGCNHRYNKVIDTPVFQHGRLVDRTWLAYVRFRGIPAGVDLRLFEEELSAAGVLREVVHDEGVSQAVNVDDLERIGYSLLSRNPWAFCSRKIEVRITESNPELNQGEGPVAEVSYFTRAT